MIDWNKPIQAMGAINNSQNASFIKFIRDPKTLELRVCIEIGDRRFWSDYNGVIGNIYTIRNIQQPTPLDPTATWWAKRWWQSATDAEKAAMRELVGSE